MEDALYSELGSNMELCLPPFETTDLASQKLNDDFVTCFLNQEFMDPNSLVLDFTSGRESPPQSVPDVKPPLDQQPTGFEAPSTPPSDSSASNSPKHPSSPAEVLSIVPSDLQIKPQATIAPTAIRIKPEPTQKHEVPLRDVPIPTVPSCSVTGKKRPRDNSVVPEATSDQLTLEEERRLKRQRRLIKNRESAQLSRMRKKLYIEDLERKVAVLSSENEALHRQIDALLEENKRLKDENSGLRGGKAPPSIVVQPSIPPHPNPYPKIQPRPIQSSTSTQATKPLMPSAKTSGVVALVILFSFGLLFNLWGPLGLQQSAETGFSQTADFTPVSRPTRVLNSLEFSNYDPTTDNASNVLSAANTASKTLYPPSPTPVSLEHAPADTIHVEAHKETRRSQTNNKIKIEAADEPKSIKTENSTITLGTEHAVVGTPEGQEGSSWLVPRSAEKTSTLEWRRRITPAKSAEASSETDDDTAYIFCANAQRMFLPGQDPTSEKATRPRALSILVPYAAINATAGEEQEVNAVVELNCRVTDMNLYTTTTVASETIEVPKASAITQA